MKKTLLVILMFVFMYVVTGCDSLKGARGDSGTKGDKGDTGDTTATIDVSVYTGTIPYSGKVIIGTEPFNSSAVVTVLYAYDFSPTVWYELGEPTGSNSALYYCWCAVNYVNHSVTFYNCGTSWLYKIIVIKDLSLAPSLSTIDYIKGK